MIVSNELRKQKDFVLNQVIPPLRKRTLAYFKPEGLKFESKADKSPVTEADRLCEESFRQMVSLATPQFGMIGEEFGTERSEAEYVWTIDPIDGTRAFTRGLPFWGIQVGLLHNGDPVMGIVDYPALGATIWAARGMGCWHVQTQRKLQLQSKKDFAQAVLLHSGVSGFAKEHEKHTLISVASQFFLERSYGDCAAYFYLASGQADVLIDQGLQPWDCVPMFPIIEEAGGIYLTLSGEREWRHKSPFIGGSPELVHKLLKIFNPT